MATDDEGEIMTFKLRLWSELFREPFADMQSDPEVMADLGGPFDRADSYSKFDRYCGAWKSEGISRWAVVDATENFLGYAGVMKAGSSDHPLGSHYEVGWRFRREIWGQGFATKGARQALEHAWTVITVDEIFPILLRTICDLKRLWIGSHLNEISRETSPHDTRKVIGVAWFGRPNDRFQGRE
jgi:hypothetical protein